MTCQDVVAFIAFLVHAISSMNQVAPLFFSFNFIAVVNHIFSALEEHNKSKLHRRKLKMMQKGEVYLGPAERIDNGKPIIRPELEE